MCLRNFYLKRFDRNTIRSVGYVSVFDFGGIFRSTLLTPLNSTRHLFYSNNLSTKVRIPTSVVKPVDPLLGTRVPP